MYIFGGNDLQVSYQDMWALELESVISTLSHCSARHSTSSSPTAAAGHIWRQVEFPEGSVHPSNRIGHCAVPIGSRYFLMYGGRDYINSTMAEGAHHISLSIVLYHL